MYQGSYVLGQRVPLRVLSVDTSGTPVAPDTNPHVRIYDADGAVVTSLNLPALDPDQETGWFADWVSLGADFTEGDHMILYTWSVSSSNRSRVETFDIEASGDTGGLGISAHFLAQPQTDFILIQSDTGYLTRHRNPKVER